MQGRNRMFDDLARVTNGAAGVLTGFRDEAEAALRQRLERMLADMDMVPREEFDAVREMAANARREQEALSVRVAELEARLEAVSKARPTPRKTRKSSATKLAASNSSESPADSSVDTPRETGE